MIVEDMADALDRLLGLGRIAVTMPGKAARATTSSVTLNDPLR